VQGGLAATGVVWLPSGLPRACSGADLASALITSVSDGRSTHTVTLHPAGAVTGP
jgi:hypothetical protein